MPKFLKVGEGPEEVLWRPNSVPQAAFLNATEFEVLYGGAKGGAKSESLIMHPTQFVTLERFKGLILRASFPELRELLDRAAKYYPKLGGQWKAEEQRYVFPSGAMIEFGFCEQMANVTRYQGREWSAVYFDEIGNLKEERVWTDLLVEIRSPDPRVPRMARASANPGGAGHGWLKRRFVQACGRQGETIYRDPRTSLSRRFIPAKVTDNPIYANDPLYMAQLHALPEQRRKQLMDGDWDAGEGLAFPDLTSTRVAAYETADWPEHWTVFGGYDWGFNHPGCFGLYLVNGDGQVILLDTVWHRQKHLPEIHEQVTRMLERFGLSWRRVRYVAAGLDLWHDHQSREERGPTYAERLQQMGWPIVRATVSRVAGYRNALQYVEGGTFSICRTPGNDRLVQQLESLTTDPDDLEDVLKQDADENGEGGDDGYDQVRYSLMSRPFVGTPNRGKRREVAQGQSPGYDYTRHQPRERESGEEMVARWFQEARPLSPLANRHHLPRR